MSVSLPFFAPSLHIGTPPLPPDPEAALDEVDIAPPAPVDVVPDDALPDDAPPLVDAVSPPAPAAPVEVATVYSVSSPASAVHPPPSASPASHAARA
jgi:hypothetical protein